MNETTVAEKTARYGTGQPDSWWVRLLLIQTGLMLLGLLLTCRVLTPDSNGFGTHQQLGLPACGFRLLVKKPCISCGMTTSWAWLTRGNLYRACEANIGGMLLGLACFGFGIWMLISGVLAKWAFCEPSLFWIVATFVVIFVVMLSQWVVRLIE